MEETSLQRGEGEQNSNYSLALYCSYVMLLWMFSTPAVFLPSLTSHCGEEFGSHRFRDTRQDSTKSLLFPCSTTVEVQRQTCACRVSLCFVKPGILSGFLRIASFLEPRNGLIPQLGS